MNLNLTMLVSGLVFVTFIWVTMKYIWPPILHAIETREKKISDGLLAADQGQEKLKSAEEEASAIIRKAREESMDMLSACEMQRVALINEAKNKAKTECDLLIGKTKAGLDTELANAKDVLRKQVSGLVVATAAQIIGREINEKNHDDLLRQIAAKL